MANREIKKVPVDRDWFLETLKAKGVSVRSLGNPESDCYIGWHERTIRRALEGEAPSISPDLLDAIAKKIDVYPDYLVGKYAWTLGVLPDEGAKEHFRKNYMNPDAYRYRRKRQQALGTRRHLMNTLMMHGIQEERYYALDQSDRDSLFRRIDVATTNVLKDFFPESSKMELVDYVQDFEWETDRDVIEVMLDYLIEHGLASGGFSGE